MMNKKDVAAVFLVGRLIVGAFFVFAGVDSLTHLDRGLRLATSASPNPTTFMLGSGVLLVCGILAFATAAYVILCNLWALRK